MNFNNHCQTHHSFLKKNNNFFTAPVNAHSSNHPIISR